MSSMCGIINNAWHTADKLWKLKAFEEIYKVSEERALKGRILFRKLFHLRKLKLKKTFETIRFHSKIQNTIAKNNVSLFFSIKYLKLK